ncbi:hypothetical protein [Pseudoalteromonas phage PH357]|nr:hypothetical protein [Pseudoalteromonas phage PH357]
MNILTWDKEGYVINYIIEEGCTVVLSSGKSSDKEALLEKAKKQLRTYLLKGK